MKVFFIYFLLLIASTARLQACPNSFTDIKWWETASSDQVVTMLENGCTMTQTHDDKFLSLPAKYLAVVYSNTETFKALLQAKIIKVNNLDEDGNTALMHLARTQLPGSFQKSELLIEKNAEVNHRNKWGNTALHYALANNRTDPADYLNFIILLRNAGADFSIRTKNGDTSLHQAVYSDVLVFIPYMHGGIASELFRSEFINSRNFDGDTPLHLAARISSPSAVKALLEYDVNLHLLNRKRETALHAATSCWVTCNDGVIKALLDAGINPLLKNIDGLTAFETVDKDSKILLTTDFWILNDLMYGDGNK